MALEPFETAESVDVPTVRQQSVFVENRVGQLLRLTKLFEQTEIRIMALSVVYSVDCAICRMIVDDPDKSSEIIDAANFKFSETDLLVVSLPHGRRGLLDTWMALLRGEINIHYTYPLLIRPNGCGAMAVAPEDLESAAKILRERKFLLLDQQDLYNARLD